MPPVKCFLLLLTTLLLSNCATVGTKDLEKFEKYVTLVPGVSTKKDVYDKFGQPGDVQYAGQRPPAPCTWYYVKADMYVNGWSYVPYVGMIFGGTSENNMHARFLFDKRERYVSVKTETDSKYTNQWVELTRDVYRFAVDPKGPRVKQEMARIKRPFDKKFALNIAERRWR